MIATEVGDLGSGSDRLWAYVEDGGCMALEFLVLGT